MSPRIHWMVAFCALVAMCSVTLAQEEMVDNPAYQAWAKFKPGTMVTMTNQTTMGQMVMKMDMTQKLLELTPEKAVVEITIQMPQGQNSTKQEFLAKVKKQEARDPTSMPANVQGEAKVLADEEVKVADKTYKCKVVQFSGEQQGMKTSGKSWTCPDMPGQLVKMESKVTGGMDMASNMTVTAVTMP